MLALQQGSYLGSVEKSVHDHYLIASLTSYSESATQKEKHCHENPHLSFVLRGGNLEKRDNGEIERLPGTISFYHSGEYHQSVRIIDKSMHINVELQRDFFSFYDINENCLSATFKQTPDGKFLLLKMYKELVYGDEISAQSVHMLLLHLLSATSEKLYPSWLVEIEKLLRENSSQEISLGALAAAVHLHPVTVSREFHKHFSCTLGEYMRKLKVERALNLVKATKWSLTKIAFDCGFADQSHFIRTFKQFTGFVPGVYRRI